MKTTLISLLAVLFAMMIFVPRPNPGGALQAAQTNRTVFLIRFGLDGVKDVDWSGSITPSPKRLSGWQFRSADQAQAASWTCSTVQEIYWDTPYERSMRPTSNRAKVTAKGILVEFDGPQGGPVQVSTKQGSFSFDASAAYWKTSARFLNGRVEVRSVPAAARMTEGPDAEDYPSIVQASDGTLWLAYQAWTEGADRILIRKRRAGVWSPPEELAGPGDYFRTALAEDRNGRIWIVWAAREQADFHLYARAWDGRRWSTPERITTGIGSNIFHSLARDRAGNLYLSWQSSRNGNFDIYLRVYEGRKWSRELQVSSEPANDWEPSLAAAPDGRVTVVWDTYAHGNYDVVARTYQNGKLGPQFPVAASGAFEARASAQYDAQGRLWVAWDEGDSNWGKDYGNLIVENGRGLLTRRQARVAVQVNGRWMEPKTPLIDALPADLRQVVHQPKLALDGQGVPWVFFRYRVNLPQAEKGETAKAAISSRAMWRLGASSLDGGRWNPMLEFPEGFGRIDAPAAVTNARDGALEVVWVSDGRVWPNGGPREQDLLLASVPGTHSAAAPELASYTPPAEILPPSHPREADDIARIRAYRTTIAGKSYRIARGDVHRHTDISWDGNRDGSLNDSYRYAMDAAGFDYLGVCDHNGGQVPYTWWMMQKAVDLFTIPGKFTPLYSYERSLGFPNGHRNVLFAERGRPVLEPTAAEVRGEEGATKLYAYLKKFSGITASHTSATGAGTDWRDSDPAVEPMVEIYQGYRNSYERPDGPRNAGSKEPARFSAGFVSNAWAKGIQLGVQSSSDHVSTHISYAIVYVDRLERQAILDAFRARRCYAATDNLIVDFRFAEGSLKAYVRGTAPIESVTLVKSNKVIYTAPGSGEEMNFSYTDKEAESAAWYYIRVMQKDGQIAWSSPIWKKGR